MDTQTTPAENYHLTTHMYVAGVFLCLILLLVCANLTGRKAMNLFLHDIGISTQRSPKVIKELRRKGFHFSGLSIPIIYLTGQQHTTFFTQAVASYVLIFCTVVYFVFECARLTSPAVNGFFESRFKRLMREKERHNFTGSFFYLLGSTISVIFFSPPVAVCGILFLIIGDFMAALVGISFGRIKIGRKSLEGSVACFISCFMICLVFLWQVKWVEQIAFWGALAATLTELLNPSFIDDNLSIPCISGLVIHLIAHRLDIAIPNSL
eukprot:TRINITY_DN3656_c0_g1_i1.p1 TRINITY_DN3656_c0_g1~~TRINITY_DN3656_c0_g1_i1.p1  ORF type:complete len:266 (-),score=31.23 TRINITY_DN3656_c0_g1_i1:50-847(-)